MVLASVNDLTIFDWLLLVILTWSTIAAFLRGFILTLFSFLGLTVGFMIASWSYYPIASSLGPFASHPATTQITAFLIIVIGTMLLCGIIGKAVRRTAKAIGLGFFDRLLGAGFGFVRGCLINVALLMVAAAFVPHSPTIAKSRLSSYFLAGAHAVSFVVPQTLQQQFMYGAAQLKHDAPHWIKP